MNLPARLWALGAQRWLIVFYAFHLRSPGNWPSHIEVWPRGSGLCGGSNTKVEYAPGACARPLMGGYPEDRSRYGAARVGDTDVHVVVEVVVEAED